MKKEAEFFRMLIESLRLLAADYEIQVSLFPDVVDIPDEIALTYNDCVQLADQVAESGLINQNQMTALKKIDALLDSISGQDNKHFWTLDALKENPVWTSVRVMATELLSSLGKEKQRPNLDWIRFIPGGDS